MKIEKMDPEAFWPLMKKNSPKVFTAQNYSAHENMTALGRERFAERKRFLKERIELYYGLFDSRGVFVGWCCGFQLKPNEFYMMSSAVLPEHRRKGWYTKLAKTMLGEVEKLGFQLVLSNHLATNNSIIIAKLKMGFVVTGMEISDEMGILLRLSYSFSPVRSEVLKYRTGEMHPSARVKQLLNLKLSNAKNGKKKTAKTKPKAKSSAKKTSKIKAKK